MLEAIAEVFVVALGGNAIADPASRGDIADQYARTRVTARVLARLVASGRQLVITHGNGPQVGNTLQRVELAAASVYPIPLYLCVADTQAGMGVMIAQCLMSALEDLGRSRLVTTIVTSVEVDAEDPALRDPRKPIGPFLSPERAERHARDDGWRVVEIETGRWRRVVASPAPKAIVELESIRALVERGELLVCGGGGGVPVVHAPGRVEGVDAVVDKDRTSAMLAIALDASGLVILTSVPCLYEGYRTERARPIARLTTKEAREMLRAGALPAGSMGPKVEACAAFAEATGRDALICDPEGLEAALEGEGGTRIAAG